MAQHKSAERRVRTSEKRRVRNRADKSKMKNLVKQLKSSTDKKQAEELYKDVTSLLDKISTKNVVHKNFAANKKSKLARFVKQLPSA